MKLIDKDTLVEGINGLKSDALQKKSQCKRRGLEKIMHQIGTYNKILSFLDTLEVKEVDEEPVSEELEEAAKYYIPDESYHMTIESEEEGSGEYVYDYVQMLDMFKAGAKWKKEQMMKDAITATILPANLEETEFCLDDYDEVKYITRLVKEESLKIGDKVKIIVIEGD